MRNMDRNIRSNNRNMNRFHNYRGSNRIMEQNRYTSANNRYPQPANYQRSPYQREVTNKEMHHYPIRDYRHDFKRYGNNTYVRKTPSRPSSPVEGSEEYMARKIQQTSAIIMRQLLSPEEPLVANNKVTSNSIEEKKGKDSLIKDNKEKPSEKVGGNLVKSKDTNKYNVQEIHQEIMNHITKLNDGRKKNLINATTSGYDVAIQQIQKQKRLELSRVLRDMCSSFGTPQESGELINSIIPDIGIKIEELPIDVIEELRQTLNLDLDQENVVCCDADEKSRCISSLSEEVDSIEIKKEDILSEESTVTDKAANTPIDIKLENIVEETACVENEEVQQTCIYIKEEPIEASHETETSDLINFTNCARPSTFSEESAYFPNTRHTIIQSELEDETPFTQVVTENKLGDLYAISTENNRSEAIDNHEKRPECSITKAFTDITCQTDILPECNLINCISMFTEKYKGDVSNLNEIRDKTDFIDKCISELTEFRQSLFKAYFDSVKNKEAIPRKNLSNLDADNAISDDKQATKRRKLSNSSENSDFNGKKSEQSILKFPKLTEKVLVSQVVGDELIIATEGGKVIFISLKNGEFNYTLNVTKVPIPITCLLTYTNVSNMMEMYVGSLDNVLKIYNFNSKQLVKEIFIDDNIKCMDLMWDYLFLGCQNGTFLRYSIKKQKIEFTEKSVNTIMVLKATQEGPRKVLIIGHRQAPIFVRDAMSGLYLRNFSNEAISMTVYSLIIENNLLYCGTAKNSILVFSFREGYLMKKLLAPECKGITCMKIRNNILFAGCYNGLIYLYGTQKGELLTSLQGPGGAILSMEVMEDQVIVGTILCQFESVVIPSKVLSRPLSQ